jgi:hypothetical protein
VIKKIKHLYQNERFPFIVIAALGIIAWLNPSTFLWRDDWLYLSFYDKGNYDLFNGHLASEIKPLFQYVLFAEFYLAGPHFELFQAVNVLALVLGALCVYSIMQSFSLHRNASLFCTMLFLIHPISFVNAFWIFGQCELLHLLFLLLSILYFVRYLKNSRISTLLIFGIFLFVQNYFFPNGIFFPVLFAIAHFFFKKKIDTKFIVMVVVVFSINIAHALYIQTKLVDGEGLIQNILPKVIYFAKLLSTSLYRLIIPNFNPRSEIILNLIPLVAFAAFISLTIKKIDADEKRNAILISLLGIFFSSVVLTLTRFKQVEIHYYYSALHFPFLFIIIAVYVDHYRLHEIRFFVWASTLVLAGFLILDFRGKNIFSVRNTLNRQRMEIGLLTNRYVPFDDPCFQIERYIDVGPYSDAEAAVVLYRVLIKDDKRVGNENK